MAVFAWESGGTFAVDVPVIPPFLIELMSRQSKALIIV